MQHVRDFTANQATRCNRVDLNDSESTLNEPDMSFTNC